MPDGADIEFELKQMDEDRLFAYSLTMHDLVAVLDRMMKVAPPSIVSDFISAAKVLKGMVESAKTKVEEKNGIEPENSFKKHMETIMKAIAKDMGKDGLINKDGSETKIIVGGDLPEELRKKIEAELNKRANDSKGDSPKKKSPKKKGKREEEEVEEESSGDIEM